MKNSRRGGVLVAAGLASMIATSALAVDDANVAASAEEIRPLLVGSAVPSVTVRTIDGTEVDLREVVLQKPSVLVFYRGGW